MPENTIFQLLGNVYREISQSYTGGAVDVYIPHNRTENIFTRSFKKLYYYDVNALYPFVMASTPMPIGKPVAFIGDILQFEPNAFGFFYCEITSPNYLEHPILHRRIKTTTGIRTVAGLGTWKMWIYSEEMYNAMKHGYKFTVIHGYQFEKGNIFKDYVQTMYDMRLEFPKGHPMNDLAKLLQNSLYGKFGMKPETTVVDMFDITNPDQFKLLDDMLKVYADSVQDWIKVGNHIILIRNKVPNFIYNQDTDLYHGLNVNVAIASAVTASGRMWMTLLKNNPDFNLYYSDTDSGIIDRPLPPHMVGTALGQFKIEHVINRAVFLAPKVYGFINEKGEEIVKVKGITKDTITDVHVSDLESLLFLDSAKEFTQEKWFNKTMEGEISVADVIYTLKVTSNKRKTIYIDRVFSNTRPYLYDDIIDTNADKDSI